MSTNPRPAVDDTAEVDESTLTQHARTQLRSDGDAQLRDQQQTKPSRWNTTKKRFYSRCGQIQNRVPYLRALPLPAILIILLLVVINLVVWAVCGLVLATRYTHLLSTAALAYSLGLRHALDADHISAIDLMTRRLIATGQRPVTVGTFFSLGHSTIVVITSIVVAATAASVSNKFGSFSTVGGIIGSSVSAAFLIALGLMNAYILYKLIVQLRKVIRMQPEQEANEAWKVEGGGVLFRILKRMFKLIDRPWKMYPLGVLFGLGFDTSSEVALLGISSIQGAQGTSIWLILVFPVLFTVGMCLIDTIDGALMSSLYLAPMGAADTKEEDKHAGVTVNEVDIPDEESRGEGRQIPAISKVRSPLTFLYYSTVLTGLTVVVALIIGVIQLLTLIVHVAVSDETAENSLFWRGVNAAGENYDIIGAAICGSFIVVGIVSVFCYRPWRRWVERERRRLRVELREADRGIVELLQDGSNVEPVTLGPGSSSTSDDVVPTDATDVKHASGAGKASSGATALVNTSTDERVERRDQSSSYI